MINERKFVLVAIAILATATTLAICKFVDKDLKEAYGEVDMYLKKKIPDKVDNVQLSMNKIAVKLKKEELFGTFTKKKTNFFIKKRRTNYIQAMKNILALKIVDGKSACSEEAYKILAQNDRSTIGLARTKSDIKKTHVEEIVNHYAVKHAQKCSKTYLDSYQLAITKVPSSSLMVVELFMNKIIFKRLCGFVPTSDNMDACHPSADELSEKLPSITSLEAIDVPLVLEQLKTTTKGKIEERQLKEAFIEPNNLNVAKLTRIVRVFLGGPCKDYNEILGPSVLDQVDYDYNMLGVQTVSNSSANLYLALTRFRLCKAILEEPNKVTKDVLNYVEAKSSSLMNH